MQEYKFKFKRRSAWFWQSETACGHKYFQELDKMVVYFAKGGLREISKWSECELRLGPDWTLSVQHNMKKESGQDVQLNIGG